MYTFKPKTKHAKAYGSNLSISTKASVKVCKSISGKPFSQAKGLLNKLINQEISLQGKYYVKVAKEILKILKSCGKNADFKGLDSEKLIVHASAHQGSSFRRRRRKSSFGNRIKNTNISVFLMQKGKGD